MQLRSLDEKGKMAKAALESAAMLGYSQKRYVFLVVKAFLFVCWLFIGCAGLARADEGEVTQEESETGWDAPPLTLDNFEPQEWKPETGPPPAGSTEYQKVIYVKTIDGDTLWLRIAGVDTKCRLLGISAGEVDTGTSPAFMAAYLLAYICETSDGLKVLIDPACPTDNYGHTLVWLYSGGRLINAQLILADAVSLWPQYQSKMVNLEEVVARYRKQNEDTARAVQQQAVKPDRNGITIELVGVDYSFLPSVQFSITTSRGFSMLYVQAFGIDNNGDIVGHGNDIVPALRAGDTWISNVTLLGEYAGDSETFTWQYTLR